MFLKILGVLFYEYGAVFLKPGVEKYHSVRILFKGLRKTHFLIKEIQETQVQFAE